ncbi:MAG: hypothetical protein SRB1_00640 [Desulfobacteraceae bacterium Eth-SRB1]|nr:MAG: hypothetical protein SRB1_00640 [Desulfobacteraceae bacterium Eth-SRB1]
MKKLRCAIYCRVSTEIQKEADTIASQKTQLPKFAKSQGWIVYDMYIDEGISGSFISGREDFSRLMTDMAKNKFDVLLVAEHSRVTRTEDPGERGWILKLLKDNKIKLASPAEGILDLSMFTGELMTTLKLMFAGEEKAEMARRFKRGRDEKLRSGVYCLTSVPYGLRKIVDKTVVPVKHKVVIDHDENQILRTVYNQIVQQGRSINSCAYYLNENGMDTRKGKKWSVGGLSSILRNEGGLTGCIYTGRYIWKTKGNGKQKLLEVKPLSEAVKVQVPAIFTEAEFKLLREKIEANKRNNLIKKEGFLLRGKLRCAMCGAKFVPTSGGNVKNKIVKYYACYNRIKSPKRREPGETPCKAPFVNMQVLDQQIERNLFSDLFRNPKRTLKLWTDTKSQKSNLDQIKRKLKKVEKDIKSNDQASAKLLHSFIKNLFTEKQLEVEQGRLQGQKKLLEDERQKLTKEYSNSQILQANLKIVKNTGDQIKELVKNVRSIKKMSFNDRQKLLEAFILPGSFIEIEPRHDNEISMKKVPELSRKVKVSWDFRYSGAVDFQAVVEALKMYVKTGKMPDSSVNYIDVSNDCGDSCYKQRNRRLFDQTF